MCPSMISREVRTADGAGGGPTVLNGAADWGPALFDATLVKTSNPGCPGSGRYIVSEP